MKKIWFCVLIIWSPFLDLFEEQHYYWVYGEKHQLQIFTEKSYVVVDSRRDKNGLSVVLGVDSGEIQISKP